MSKDQGGRGVAPKLGMGSVGGGCPSSCQPERVNYPTGARPSEH
jgi:hypothetical protein